jgi:Cu/Ag efflux pump CusA
LQRLQDLRLPGRTQRVVLQLREEAAVQALQPLLPLALSTGAGSASQRAIGTGVIGGILTGTSLAVVFVPIFFVVVRSLFKDNARQQQIHAAQAEQMGVHSHE